MATGCSEMQAAFSTRARIHRTRWWFAPCSTGGRAANASPMGGGRCRRTGDQDLAEAILTEQGESGAVVEIPTQPHGRRARGSSGPRSGTCRARQPRPGPNREPACAAPRPPLRRRPVAMAGSSPRARRQSASGPNPWSIESDARYSAPSSSKDAVSEPTVRSTSGNNACCSITWVGHGAS